MAAPNLIIGLGHRKRVGKDTFADFLDPCLSSLGWWVVRIPFALRMKQEAYELFGWGGLRGSEYYERFHEMKEIPLVTLGRKSPRQIWIELGNALRTIQPDVWVENLKKEIEWYCGQYKNDRKIAVIIPDVRFPNEAEAVKQWGGTLIKINRSDAPIGNDISDNALAEYEGWDDIVDNDAGLGELSAKASWLANCLITHATRDQSPIPFIGEGKILS